MKLKTNAFMIGEKEADRLAGMHLEAVQVSIYSHRPEVHDEITKLPHSLERTVEGIRRLRKRGVKVIIANVLMRQNLGGLRRSEGAGAGIGRRIYHRPHHHADDERRPLHCPDWGSAAKTWWTSSGIRSWWET